MKAQKLSIAITGSIGSGKSLFCQYIAALGYPVINADELSKKILKENKSVKQKVIKEFGEESFAGNEINKKYLAEKIFSDPARVVRINSIIHPAVKKDITRLISEYLKTSDIVFTEAALIYEAGMEPMFDYVVLITADINIRQMRIISDGKFSREEFMKRNYNQISDEEKKKRADFIFENNSQEYELKAKADILIKVLKGLLQKKN